MPGRETAPMVGRRRLLLGLGAAILGVGLLTAVLMVRGDRDEDVAAAGTGATTTTSSPSSTTSMPRPTTTTASPTTTTAAPTTTTEPASPPPTTGAPSTTAPTPRRPGAARSGATAVPGVDRARHDGAAGLVLATRTRLPRCRPAAGAEPLPLGLRRRRAPGPADRGRQPRRADRRVFRDLYAARFPIQRMVPVDAYGGDDGASMRANNTSGFNCRTVAGSTTLSEHGKGLAIDVNPLVNPYVSSGGSVDPPEGAAYADRSRRATGMIHAGDAVVAAFARQGWGWGGSWSSAKDYQHFSASGR